MTKRDWKYGDLNLQTVHFKTMFTLLHFLLMLRGLIHLILVNTGLMCGAYLLQYVEDNLCVMSIGFLLSSPDDAIIWRGPKKNGMFPYLWYEM